MAPDLLPASILAFGIWIIFAVAMFGPSAAKQNDDLWVMTRSDKLAVRPALVRAAPPRPGMIRKAATSE